MNFINELYNSEDNRQQDVDGCCETIDDNFDMCI